MITITPPSTAIAGPPTDRPLLLLPVRLETRFVSEPDGPKLLVRVYVEDLAVEWHDPELSESEVTWGRAFWEQIWRSGANEARQRAAWGQLVERFGAPRAAFIAETLQPTSARPTTEIAADAKLAPPPDFPKLTPPDPARVRAPRTRVMPDRWLALGWVGSTRAFAYGGRPIQRDPVIVGPSPDATRGFDARTLAADPDIGWLVDFNAAEAIGMGLRIPYALPAGARLDRLLVVGVRGALSADEGAARLTQLFRSHRYTDGLAFVPQATPTNNTPDTPSGFNTLDLDYQTSPSAAAPSFTAGDGSNRDVLARALGVDDAVFTRVPGANALEQRDAYHMNTVLWKAAWGYALEQLMDGPGSPSDDAIRLGREHFSSYVRARGPLPALRVGRQPYGILPAISLDRWQPREGGAIDDPLRRFLVAAREVWRRALPGIPRVPFSPDPSADLLRVLAMAPGAIGYATRRAARLLQTATGSSAPPTTSPPPATGNLRAQKLARDLGLTWTPRHVRAILAANPPPGRVAGALVQPPPAGGTEVLSETQPLPKPNYLTLLAGGDDPNVRQLGYDDIRQQQLTPLTAPPNALLYLLLRHAALHEYLGAAFRILRRRNAVTPEARREPEATNGAATPWDLLTKTLADAGGAAAGTFLDGLKPRLRGEGGRDAAAPGAIWRRNLYEVAAGAGGTPDVAPDVREFAAFLRALDYLATRPSAALGRALAETLDLCSHRFDAWATSFATKRLEWLRGRNARGLYLGGYGWVEDLAPTPRQNATPPTVDPPESPPPPELATPLSVSSGNQGYVHAPSLAHATTAAILRSGYLSHRATRDGNALAINLSSSRVRTAQWLLDGVRQGQPLSSLLGYRFERGLHENHPDQALDRFIPWFRRLASPAVTLPAPGGEQAWKTTVSALPADSVVDGMALVQRFRAPAGSPQSIPWGVAGLLPRKVEPDNPADPDWALYKGCRDELRALDDALDAVADLVLAESVHHVAQGNSVRAGSTLEAVAHGEAPPPQIDVARTPRTGVGITHRLLALFDATAAGSAWGATTPRAQAEPFLNAWVARLLGPAAPTARCRVEYLDPTTGSPLVDGQGRPRRLEPTLADLGLAPIDLIHLPEQEGTAQQSELEQRVARFALRPRPDGARPDGVPEDASLRIVIARQAEWPAQTLGFADALEVVRAVRRLIQGTRALTPRDLALPETAIPATADAEPTAVPAALRLATRAQAAADGLRAATQQLQTALTTGTQPPAAEAMRTGLMTLAAYGISGAVPVSATGDSPAIRLALQTQAASVAREAAARVQRLDAVEKEYNARVATLAAATPPTQPSSTETRDYHLNRLAQVFGPELRVLPPFAVLNAAEVRSTLAASDTLQARNPHEAMTWFQRAARVRDGAGRLHAALLYAEALGGASLGLSVGQLPYLADDRWVGLPLVQPATADGRPPRPPRPPGGRLSLVVHAPTAVDPTKPVVGLLVDEWTEVVPSPQETTGLVFHYDQPSARAPQAILLAVAPDGQPAWDLETLEATLLETIELAKLRTVDPAVLSEAAPYLPALYFAEGSPQARVTSNFAPLVGPEA